METDTKKRKFLVYLSGTLVGGGMIGVSLPALNSFTLGKHKTRPFRDVDISKLKEGQMLSVNIFGRPLYILKRTQKTLDLLDTENPKLLDPLSNNSRQPLQARNKFRSIRPDTFVAWGMCTHLGCSVSHNPPGGSNSEYDSAFKNGLYFCPCHGSKYDLAGRVYKQLPAKENLVIPDYEFVSDTIIRIKNYR